MTKTIGKAVLALFTVFAVGCGTSNFIQAAQAQGPLQDLELPASIVPIDRFAQIDINVPFRPTFVPSGGNQYLTYELNVGNPIPVGQEIVSVEVVNADTNETVESLTGSALRRHVRLSGAREFDESLEEPVPLGEGQSAYVFFFIEISGAVPQNLTHRIVFNGPGGEQAVLNHDSVSAVDMTPPTVLSPPLAGGPFFCDGAPGFDSYHRRTLLAVDGLNRVSQRYAIDFEILTPGGTTFNGSPNVNDNYPIYGQPILASASGRVARIVDGLPDNTPPEVPTVTSVDAVGGNGVMIDLGNDRFLVYGHMQPGSITVSEGDDVVVGQQLGLVGNSGNSFEPHVHIQVCDKPSFLGSQGLPYVYDNYTLIEGAVETPIQNQIPLLNQVIRFPGAVASGDFPRQVAARTHPKCGWH